MTAKVIIAVLTSILLMSNLLVVGCNGDLYHKRPDQSVVEILEGHDDPARWLR